MQRIIPIGFILFSLISMAQVGIGTSTPSESSVLDIESSESGVLIPRVDISDLSTQAPIAAATMEESLLVYNTNLTTGKGFYYWGGSSWTAVLSGDYENIYTTNGSLAANRIITQNANRLTFNSQGSRNGLALQRTNNAFENGIGFQNSGGFYEASIYNEGNTNSGLVFATQGSNNDINNVLPTMTLQNDGDVGIGSTNPFFKLHINVGAETYDGIFFENTGANPFTSEIMMYRVDGANHLYLENNDPNGRIGFGFAGLTEYFMSAEQLSPTASLTSDLGSPAYKWDNLFIQDVFTTNLYGDNATGRLNLGLNGAIRSYMTVTQFNPSTNGVMDLGSNALNWNRTYSNNVFTSNVNGNDTTGRLNLSLNGATRVFMTTSELSPNASGVMTLGAGSRRWQGIFLQNAPNVSSDRRLKKNIEELTYGLDDVLKIKSYRYLLNDDATEEVKIGFIAQELQQVIPEIVKGQESDDSFLSVTYTEMIPILLNAIKEQQAIIASQQDALSSQKEITASILTRLDQLENNERKSEPAVALLKSDE